MNKWESVISGMGRGTSAAPVKRSISTVRERGSGVVTPATSPSRANAWDDLINEDLKPKRAAGGGGGGGGVGDPKTDERYSGFLGPVRQKLDEDGISDKMPYGLGMHNAPKPEAIENTALTIQQKAETEEENTLAGWNSALTQGRGATTVRQLTNEEWAALTPEQQQGVISNFALYQASLKDRTGASAVEKDEHYDKDVKELFGTDRSSEVIAPETVRVLADLGFKHDQLDLDQILNGNAIASYEDILGQTQGGAADGRRQVFESLAQAELYDTSSIQEALKAGQSLLDSLRNADNASSIVVAGKLNGEASHLTGEEDRTFLSDLALGMANREMFARYQSDPDINTRMTQQIQQANEMYGPQAVSDYFVNTVHTFDNHSAYMTPEEFAANWMGN